MSGLEIVGTIASVSQIISQVLQISRSIKELGQTVVEFQRHQDSLCIVISATQSIQKQPCLRTEYIDSYLQHLLIRLETLRTALRRYVTNLPKTPFQKIKWALRYSELRNSIEKQFTALETDKSTLLLCMFTSTRHYSNCPPSLVKNEMASDRINQNAVWAENAAAQATQGTVSSQALATTSHADTPQDLGQHRHELQGVYVNRSDQMSQRAHIKSQSIMQQKSVQEQPFEHIRKLVMKGKKTITEVGGAVYSKNKVGRKGLMANRPNEPLDRFIENEAEGGILMNGNTENGELAKMAEHLYKDA
ncbi:MAG: hypothetical protein M1820_004389 [Bogoriella megaspora]|nr:MAG: hypothetical protein M1820_004389 [Bogoriella megaspora]